MTKNKITVILAVIMLLLLKFTAYAEDASVALGSVTDTEETEYVPVKIDTVYSGRGDEQYRTAAAIDEDGSLWMWGDNSFGKCLCEEDYVSEPTKIMTEVTEIAIGEGHVAVLKNDGTLWTWGKNNYGQLGIGEISVSNTTAQIMEGVVKISAGRDFTLALKENGDLYGFGRNNQYAYSDAGRGRFETPQLIMSGVRNMTAGDEWCFITDSYDCLYVIGFNGHGQLGNGGYQTVKRLYKLMGNVKSVSAGSDYTLIVTKTGDLYGCGKNFYGQLGSSILGATIPVKICSNVKDAFCGEYFSLIVSEDGTLSRLGGKNVGFINNTASELSVLAGSIYNVTETGIPLALDFDGNVHLITDDALSDVDIKTPAELITEIKYLFYDNGTITTYVTADKAFGGGVGVFAFYSGSKLTSVSLRSNMKAGDAVTLTPPSGSDCCRIFLFENLTGSKPLAEHKELNLSSNINMQATAVKREAEGYDITYDVNVSISLNSLEFSQEDITFVMIPDTSQEVDLYNAMYIYQGALEKDGSLEVTFPVHKEFSNMKIRAAAGGVNLGECYVVIEDNQNSN